jgi:hypothetical protein
VQVFRAVSILLAFEERNEHVVFPIIVKPALILEDLVDFDDALRAEGSQSAFEQGDKLLLHFRREVLVADFVVPEEEVLKLMGVEIIQMLLNVVVHLLPEFWAGAPEFLHQIVHRDMIILLYPKKLGVNLLKCLAYPWV